jgi:hypothetical protein
MTDEEVPSAHVMIYTIVGNYLATGELLFKNIYVRTSSKVCDYRMTIGVNEEGIDIGVYNGYCVDGESHAALGIATARHLGSW